MKHKTLWGGMSTSSVLRYSDEAQTYEIYSPWKNGNAKVRLKRPVDVIPYAELTTYTTYAEPDVQRKSGLGRAVGLGILFGPVGAVVGAVTGGGDFELVKQISIGLHTAAGDDYIIPILYAPVRGEKSSSPAARGAIEKLEEIVAKIESTGATFDPNLSARI